MYFIFFCVGLALEFAFSTAVNEPCVIPEVDHGHVGNYVTRRYSARRYRHCFHQFQPGESINNAQAVILRCDDGFFPSGSLQVYRLKEDEAICEDGIWSKPLHCEEEITCGEPPPIEFATITSLFSKDYPIGAIVAYECQPEYIIKGRTTTSECRMSDDGSEAYWTKAPMSCAKAACDIPLAPEHGSVKIFGSEDNPGAGTIAVFSCNEGRIPEGSTNAMCLDIGEWTSPPPQCWRKSCSIDALFSVLPHGIIPDLEDVVDLSLPYNSVLRLTCKDGMTLVGSPLAKCGSREQWEIQSVQCVYD